jgi:HK97 family phage major capsid protein
MGTAVQAPNFTRSRRLGYPNVLALLHDIKEFAGTGVQSERLRFLLAQGSDEQQAASDPWGGYLVPQELLPRVLRVRPEDDPMAAVTPIPMDAPEVYIAARVDKDHSTSVTGGIVTTRHPETVDIAAQRGELERIHINSHTLASFLYASERLLNDSPRTFEAWLVASFGEALADRQRNERLRGTGVGEPLGVLKSPCLITVAKEGGQSAATVVAENALKMASRCWAYDRAGTTWTANPMLRQQLAVLEAPNGKNLYRFATTDGERDRLCGRPVYYDERASAPGSVGDLVLGAWPEYLDGRYRPTDIVSSIHVRFAARERAFRFTQRGDGMPWWRSELTPQNASDTMSPFVTLAERS